MPDFNPSPIHATDLVPLLAPSLGQTQSTRLIQERMKKLGLPTAMTHAQALALLDALATEPGTAGTVARFAKARFILKLAG